jgi:hypothetical protein
MGVSRAVRISRNWATAQNILVDSASLKKNGKHGEERIPVICDTASGVPGKFGIAWLIGV